MFKIVNLDTGKLELVMEKPPREKVKWFAVDSNGSPVPHVTDDVDHVAKTKLGVKGSTFETTQLKIFEEYYSSLA